MPPISIDTAVYAFEGLLPDLEAPPIAARRALDHAGVRLSMEGWRSLPLEDRQRMTIAGVPDRVDADLVAGMTRRANPPAQRISPVADPDPTAPPEALARALEPSRSIDPRRWARLRAVDRYALAHTYRRAVARSAFSILGEAFDAVVAASSAVSTPPMVASSTPPHAYQPAGYYASAELREATGRSSGTGYEGRSSGTGYEARPGDTGARLSYTPPAPSVDSVPSPRTIDPSPARAAYEPAGRGFATYPPPAGTLSNHLNQAGEVHMVDVARKPKTERRAIARGTVIMRPDTLSRLMSRDAPKGEVLATARIAGVLAAKRAHEIIPLCHSVQLTHLEVQIDIDAPASSVHVTATADAYDRTGCEMEAMVAASTACLTIYDMLKGIDRDMLITDVKLMEKSGGRSGHYKRADVKP